MALNFNPFDKGTAAPTPKTKKSKHAHYRVFDDPTLDSNSSKKSDSAVPHESIPQQQITRKEESASDQTEPSLTLKPVANWEQTGSKLVAKTSSKLVANWEQTGSDLLSQNLANKTKPVAQPVAQPVANQWQTGSKLVANSELTHVVGHEQKILCLLFDECRKEGSLTSPPLTKDFISKNLETSHGTVKSVILRLERKGLLRREKSKVGRGGWLQLSLPRELFQKMLLSETGSKPVANGEQTGSATGSKLVAQPVASPPSSSSFLRSTSIKELLTTGNQSSPETESDAPWQAIDCSPLAEMRFGRSQISQIAQSGRVSPDQLQDSIYAFAFDLSENEKAKRISGAPLNFFMGILRKGPYAPPANYESPEDRQQRLYLEAKEKQRKHKHEMEGRLETVEFEEWAEKLSVQQRGELVPPKEYAKPGGTAHNVQLREYFRENVWPQLREKNARDT